MAVTVRRPPSEREQTQCTRPGTPPARQFSRGHEERTLSNDPDSAVSRRFVFRGRVQGVGFRYSVRSLAKHYPVVGYVRNLADGTVEMLVRGQLPAVNDFVLRIGEQFTGNISQVDSSEAEFSQSLTGFEIRF